MSDNLNTTSSTWLLGEKQDFGSADWQRGRRIVDRYVDEYFVDTMADSVNRTNSTWFLRDRQDYHFNRTLIHSVKTVTVNSTATILDDRFSIITSEDCLPGVLCLGAVLLLIGLAVYALVRFEKESLQRRRRAMERHLTETQQGPETNRNRKDAIIETRERYIDASELPSDVEFGDDDVFYDNDDPRAQQTDIEAQRQKHSYGIVDSAG